MPIVKEVIYSNRSPNQTVKVSEDIDAPEDCTFWILLRIWLVPLEHFSHQHMSIIVILVVMIAKSLSNPINYFCSRDDFEIPLRPSLFASPTLSPSCITMQKPPPKAV